MKCKNCTHDEVCKYKEKFEMCQGTNDRKPFEDMPIVVESKCTKYKSKEINTCGSCIPDYNVNIFKKGDWNWIPTYNGTITK